MALGPNLQQNVKLSPLSAKTLVTLKCLTQRWNYQWIWITKAKMNILQFLNVFPFIILSFIMSVQTLSAKSVISLFQAWTQCKEKTHSFIQSLERKSMVFSPDFYIFLIRRYIEFIMSRFGKKPKLGVLVGHFSNILSMRNKKLIVLYWPFILKIRKEFLMHQSLKSL